MPMQNKNTYTLAYEACDIFFSETGLMPTIESIKKNISVNSPTTISMAIKDWKQALAKTLKYRHDNTLNLPPPLMDAFVGLWEHALAEARSSLNEQAIELQDRQNALDAKEKIFANESQRVNQMLGFAEEKYRAEINYLKNEISRLTTESINLAEQTERHRSIAIENEKINAVLTEQIRQERDKCNRLETLYEKEHAWALKRIEEEKNNLKLHTKKEMERLSNESNRNKQSAELLQAKLDLMVKQTKVSNDRALDLERSLVEEKLKYSAQALIEAKLQNDLNAKNKQIRLLLNKEGKKKR
jgi:hypothetical protein